MAEPDYLYDPDDWEYTREWEERDEFAADLDVEFSGIKKFNTLIKGPEMFCVFASGEYQWFKTRGEAEAVWKADASKQTIGIREGT